MRRLSITNMTHRTDWEPLRRLPRALVRLEHSISPCDTCAGNCCYPAVELTVVEAVRMGLTLVLPLASFLEPRPWTSEAEERDIDATHPIVLDAGRSHLFLRREQGEPCRFLHVLDGRGRCTAYGVRPGVCRTYPYAFFEDEDKHLAIGSKKLCPTGWLYDESVEEALTRSMQAWREDIALDKELCERWNDEPREDRSFEVFARFAVTTLAPRLGLDAERLYPPERRGFNARRAQYES